MRWKQRAVATTQKDAAAGAWPIGVAYHRRLRPRTTSEAGARKRVGCDLVAAAAAGAGADADARVFKRRASVVTRAVAERGRKAERGRIRQRHPASAAAVTAANNHRSLYSGAATSSGNDDTQRIRSNHRSLSVSLSLSR